MLNTQEHITTELEKILYEILPLTSKRLKNLVHIIIGIILSESVVLSKISQKLKDDFTDATEDSKIKRIDRFFRSSPINPEYVYSFFIEEILKKYVKRSENNKEVIIFDHTTLDDRFLILKFSLKVGKRAIRFLKSPVYIGSVYLKKKERVKALGYVFILVLLIAAYLEYRVRNSLKKNNEFLPQPGKKKTKTPSVKTILEVLETVIIVVVNGERHFSSNINPIILKMIEWTGFDTNIYLKN